MDKHLPDLRQHDKHLALDIGCRGMVEAVARHAKFLLAIAASMSTAEIEEHIVLLTELTKDETPSTAASARFIGFLFVEELAQRRKTERANKDVLRRSA